MKSDKKYALGDSVWHAFSGYVEREEVCPVCYGKLTVKLILGNDEPVTLPCSFCAPGYSSPTGKIKKLQYVEEAALKKIDAVNILQTEEGEIIEYQSGTLLLRPDRIFETKEEALLCAGKLVDEENMKEENKHKFLLSDKKSMLPWNAGCFLQEAEINKAKAKLHRKKARQHEREAKQHEKKADKYAEKAQLFRIQKG